MPRKSAGGNGAKHARLKSNKRENTPSIDPHDEGNPVEEDDNEDASMFEMMTLLQDLKKRKTKSSAQLSAFTLKKNALYDDARKNASAAVRDGVAYIEQYKTVIGDLKAQEVKNNRVLEESALFAEQEECVRAILAHFPPLFEDLSCRRAETINDTSAMLEAHSAERNRSLLRLYKSAQTRIQENYDNQKIATDASALIKNYKALLFC